MGEQQAEGGCWGRTAGGRRVVRVEEQRKEGCQGSTAGGRKVVKW